MLFLIQDYRRELNAASDVIVTHIEGDTEERIGGYYVYVKRNESCQIISGNRFASATAEGVKFLFGNGNAATLDEAIEKANRI